MILVFKTSVAKKSDVKKVKDDLNKLNVPHWNFDLSDPEKILRVDASNKSLQEEQICSMLRARGFSCESLED